MTEPAQRTPAWFEARRNRVTGSVVGGILGLSPYMKRSDVMRLMVRESLGAEREFQGNIATEFGAYNEPGALIEFQMESGLRVRPAPFLIYEDWLGASPDGFTSDGGLVEIKCPFGLRKDENPEFKSIDDQPHYYAQMQIQMLVTGRQSATIEHRHRHTGATHCHFYQWSPNGTKLECVKFDQLWIDENLPKLRQFHAEFLDELANNADEHLAPKRVEIDTLESSKMVAEWDEVAEQLERLAERKRDLLNEMVALAGEKNALLAGRKLTLTKRDGAVLYAKIVKEHCKGVDLDKYRGKPSEFWSLK